MYFDTCDTPTFAELRYHILPPDGKGREAMIFLTQAAEVYNLRCLDHSMGFIWTHMDSWSNVVARHHRTSSASLSRGKIVRHQDPLLS